MKHCLAVLALSAIALGASAHQGAPRDAKGSKASVVDAQESGFGRPDTRRNATRTIRIDMNDKMRFFPGALTIKQGETVRFVVRNSGRILHEMVLGTMQGLKEHAELMTEHPGMEHDEPNMVHVSPGKSGNIVWKFTKHGEFHYGCLVPGHFEAGMVGTITVVPK